MRSLNGCLEVLELFELEEELYPSLDVDTGAPLPPPDEPGVCLIVAVTPSFFGAATILSLFGQFTVVPAPWLFFHSSLIALRWVVNTKVVPLESARRTTVMSWSGRLTPGFAALSFGSLHLVILPRKIPV